jgi:hypothetical protein
MSASEFAMWTVHPARISLVILSALGIVLLGFRIILRQRARQVYQEQIAESRRERLLLASVAFSISFALVRVLTHEIRAGRGPFHNVEVGGRHIHHLVWGILLLLAVGYGWLLQIGTGTNKGTTWAGRLLSIVYGVGAALTLDEFALWLNLQDVYWEREGRASIDAVILFGGLLSVGIWGGPFLHALFSEAKRIRGRT